jgi:hypothetical protein
MTKFTYVLETDEDDGIVLELAAEDRIKFRSVLDILDTKAPTRSEWRSIRWGIID